MPRRLFSAPLRAKQALALLPLVALGCASIQDLFATGEATRPEVDAAERPARIATLEASIEADHETLEALVSDERTAGADPLHENETLRAIVERLSQDEDELEALLRAEKLNR